MSLNPTVTVGIPTGGRIDNLRVAIPSVLNQTFTGWQAFVITETRIPEVETLVASYGDDRLHYAIAPNAVGSPTPKYNYLMDQIDTEFCAFLHDDDAYLPNYLERMLAVFAEYPSARWGFSNARYGKLNTPSDQFVLVSDAVTKLISEDRLQFLMQLAMANIFLCFPTIMLRREMYKSFRLKRAVREATDWQWELRLMRAADCVFVGEPIYQYYVNSGLKPYHLSGGLFLSEMAVYTWLLDLPELASMRALLLQKQQEKQLAVKQMLARSFDFTGSEVTHIG